MLGFQKGGARLHGSEKGNCLTKGDSKKIAFPITCESVEFQQSHRPLKPQNGRFGD